MAAIIREQSSPAGDLGLMARKNAIVIETYNLTKTFQSFRRKDIAALRNVSLCVERGSIFGLIGQNGAGKSTLIKILLGLSKPSSGCATLLGCSSGNTSQRRRVGYLPEAMRIPEHFRGADFLHYIGRLQGVERSVLQKRIPNLLMRVGLPDVEKPVKHYSKGMQQRLGLAQALINDPEVLFLDEPTDGLDPLGRIEVRDLLLTLRAEGKTIFLNSHLLSEIELVCDRIVVLDKGSVACLTTPQEFTRGTGEYMLRFSKVDDHIRTLVHGCDGLAIWTDDTVRFKPQDLAALHDLLNLLLQGKAQIVAVEPVRFSLEKLFIQVVSDRSTPS
jgi:ABC-2 type transport system ATP-binding protein